jgi:hypothetical protein
MERYDVKSTDIPPVDGPVKRSSIEWESLYYQVSYSHVVTLWDIAPHGDIFLQRDPSLNIA